MTFACFCIYIIGIIQNTRFCICLLSASVRVIHIVVCGCRLFLLMLHSTTQCDSTQFIHSCQRACGGPPLNVLERVFGCAHAHWGREPQPQGASVQGRRVPLGRRGWRGPEVFTLASAVLPVLSLSPFQCVWCRRFMASLYHCW